jgi:hypothetical protein
MPKNRAAWRRASVAASARPITNAPGRRAVPAGTAQAGAGVLPAVRSDAARRATRTRLADVRGVAPAVTGIVASMSHPLPLRQRRTVPCRPGCVMAVTRGPGRRTALPGDADPHAGGRRALAGEERGRSVGLVPDQHGGAAAGLPESVRAGAPPWVSASSRSCSSPRARPPGVDRLVVEGFSAVHRRAGGGLLKQVVKRLALAVIERGEHLVLDC